MMMVWDTIAQQAEFRPDAIAIAALDAQALTYSQFFAHLKMVRQALHDLGIDADRRIALLTQDGVQTAVTMVACCCTAPTIMVGPNTTAIEFDTILRRAGVALVVLGPSLPDHFAKTAMAAGLPILRLTRSPSDAAGVLQPDRQSDYAPGNASETVRRLPTPDDPFTIIMSSGTTGRPKMVPRTHRKIMALASMFGSYLEYGPDDVIIVPTPIHLSDGAYAGSQIWAAGGMAVYNSGEFAVTEFVEQFRRFLPTGFVGSPTLHRAIAREFETSPELLDSSRLRFVRSGTDAMAPELMARLAAQFQCNVFSYYGASETGCLALRWLDHNHLPTTFLGESVFEGLCVLDGRGNHPSGRDW